jgi:hypothetical protein
MLQDFLTGRPGLETAQTTALPASSRTAPFQPLTTSRIAELGAPGRQPAEPARLTAPQVEVIEDAGQVRKIVVTCTCCERIEIECEY